MSINGINSYGMGYYNYQSSVNNVRLRQALAKNPRFSQSPVSPVLPVENSLKSGLDFVKKYTSGMSDLMSTANELRGTNSNGVMHDMAVTSSNEAVAKAAEKLPVRSTKDIRIDVAQIARAQTNVSDGVKASDTANADMNFRVGNSTDFVDVQVSAVDKDGVSKSNIQMLEEAAGRMNGSDANIKASVIQKDGTASLELTGKSTGAAHGFHISGELGAAKGADKVKTQAQNAKYSVTAEDRTIRYESSGNDVSVDGARIGITFKGAGKTVIRADVDAQKVGAALGSLVDSYNSSIKLLNDNYERGSGTYRQLHNLVRGLGSEQSLGMLGITVNKDATLKFEKSVLQKNLKEDPAFTKELITGPGGIADKAFGKAASGMQMNSSSLIDSDLANAQMGAVTNPFNMLSMYSRSGVYSMNNYSAVGLMMNYLV